MSAAVSFVSGVLAQAVSPVTPSADFPDTTETAADIAVTSEERDEIGLCHIQDNADEYEMNPTSNQVETWTQARRWRCRTTSDSPVQTDPGSQTQTSWSRERSTSRVPSVAMNGRSALD